jgi:cell division inhibitor SepF
MGLWQKTMFYLGLVDEDRVGMDEPEPARPRPEPRRQQQPPPEPARTPAPRPEREAPQATAPTGPVRNRGAAVRPEEPSPDVRVQPTAQAPRRAGNAPREPEVNRNTYQGVQGRRVEPPNSPRRRPMADRALTDAGVVVQPSERPAVRTVSSSDLESQVIIARSYNDAQVLADHIRAAVPVVLDLRKVEPAMVRRLVDFSSGLTYALGGSMRKIGQGVVLVTPANVNISRDERRRLMDLGYYQSGEEA